MMGTGHGVEATTKEPVEGYSSDERYRAHEQRQSEAVPDGQAIGGRPAAQHRLHRHVEEGTYRQGRDRSDENAQEHKNPTGKRIQWDFMRRAGKLGRRRAEEGLMDEA